MKKLTFAAVFACFLALVALMTVPVVSAQSQGQTQATPSLAIPINSPTFAGTFQLTRFANVGGTVNAIGTLVGTVTTASGPVSIVRTISIPITPLAAATATCDILHLELGPLDLNLLGVTVHLNQIVLDIDAHAAPGNLLGNLLCSVAGLLDDPGGLARVLNQVLQIIG
jgi:hypothetical protein